MNKFVYGFALFLLTIEIGLLGLDGTFEEIKGVTYADENPRIIQVASPSDQRSRVFTSQFDIDISPNVISVDTGVVRFDPTTGISSPIIWTLTKLQLSGDLSFFNLVNDANQGLDPRTDITLELKDLNSNIIRIMTCFDAFPISWNYGDLSSGGASSTLLTEELVVKCDRVEIVKEK